MQMVHSAWNLQTEGGGSIELKAYQTLWNNSFDNENNDKFVKNELPRTHPLVLSWKAPPELLSHWGKVDNLIACYI